MTEIQQMKWDGVVGECRTHAARLRIAMMHIVDVVPLDECSIDTLSDQDAAWMDQLVYRFSKLQEAMGERLFVGVPLLAFVQEAYCVRGREN